jgi:hypothetical protein
VSTPDRWGDYARAYALGRAGRAEDERTALLRLPADDPTRRFRLAGLAAATAGGEDPVAVAAGIPNVAAGLRAAGRLQDAEAQVAAALNATEGVFPGYRAVLWLEMARTAAAAGRAEAQAYFSKALDDGYGSAWEAEALAGGGRVVMARRR